MNSFLEVELSLKNAAQKLDCSFTGDGDTILKFIGDLNYIWRGYSQFSQSCVYFAENAQNFERIKNFKPAGILLTTPEISRIYKGPCLIPNGNPRKSFLKLLSLFEKTIDYSENDMIHPGANIDPNSRILPGACIGQNAIIEKNCTIHSHAIVESGAVIREGSVIYPGVFIGHDCVIGKENIVYPNAVVGSDGFGYFDLDGERYKVPQIGNVETGTKVEIGAGTTIDRATIETTWIGDETKIDNQVQIAHNCIVGKKVYIAGKASMAGSVSIGDGAILAGNCGIKDHVIIAPGSIVLAMTGVENDTDPGKVYFGIPARPAMEMHRINSALGHLPDLVKKSKKKD